MKPKLRFKEFTDDWEEKKLGEVSEITSSKRVFQQEWTNEGIPFYRARDLVSLQKNQILSDPLYISLETYLNKIKVSGEINKDDILVTGVGSLGVPYLVKSNDKFYFKDGNILWIRNIVSDSFYTYYYFLTSKVQRHIKMEAAGSTVGTFTIQTAKQLKFKFPSLLEQEKIGTFLSLVDQRIEKAEKKVSLLKEEKKGWMQKLFQQEIRFKDEQGNDYPDWEEKKFSKDTYIKARVGWKNLKAEEYVEEGIPMIAGKHIRLGKIDWENADFITEERYEESPEIALQNGDVIFSKDGTLGNPAYIENLYGKATINGTMMLIRLSEKNDGINSRFFYYILQSSSFLKLINIIKSGGTVPHIFQRDIINFRFNIPISLPEQEKIANFLSLLDQRIEKEERKVELLKEEKKGLLQNMFV